MRLEVYYDSWCPLCCAAAAKLERWDWRRRLRLRSIRDPQAVAASGVTAVQLERRMYVRDLSTGATAGGIDALAALASQVPLLMPLWPALKLSSLLGLGQPLYDWVASRRRIVPVGSCENGSCQIHGKGGRDA